MSKTMRVIENAFWFLMGSAGVTCTLAANGAPLWVALAGGGATGMLSVMAFGD